MTLEFRKKNEVENGAQRGSNGTILYKLLP
jgi:hypothetical protein